jgi:hypothetical protein
LKALSPLMMQKGMFIGSSMSQRPALQTNATSAASFVPAHLGFSFQLFALGEFHDQGTLNG